jgi:hypothetical protein
MAASFRMAGSRPGTHAPSALRRCCEPMLYVTKSDALACEFPNAEPGQIVVKNLDVLDALCRL